MCFSQRKYGLQYKCKQPNQYIGVQFLSLCSANLDKIFHGIHNKENTLHAGHGHGQQSKYLKNSLEEVFSRFLMICKLLCPRSPDSKYGNYYLREK